MTTLRIILETKREIKTVEDIIKSRCGICGYALDVSPYHVGGHPNGVPFVCCSNPDGGHTHIRVRIPERLAWEYNDFVHAEETAYGLWQEDEGGEQQ